MPSHPTCVHCGTTFSVSPSVVRKGKARYCSRPCYYAATSISPEERFWAKVDRRGAIPPSRPDLGPCWYWTGYIATTGYGQFNPAPGRPVGAHVYAYLLTHGTLAAGVCIRHRCDVRRCCNPSHLEPGSPAENSRDMRVRGRAATGERHSSRTHPERLVRGEHVNTAVLSEADVRAMRAMRVTGSTYKQLAATFGVNLKTAWKATTGKTWKHVV